MGKCSKLYRNVGLKKVETLMMASAVLYTAFVEVGTTKKKTSARSINVCEVEEAPQVSRA